MCSTESVHVPSALLQRRSCLGLIAPPIFVWLKHITITEKKKYPRNSFTLPSLTSYSRPRRIFSALTGPTTCSLDKGLPGWLAPISFGIKLLMKSRALFKNTTGKTTYKTHPLLMKISRQFAESVYYTLQTVAATMAFFKVEVQMVHRKSHKMNSLNKCRYQTRFVFLSFIPL